FPAHMDRRGLPWPFGTRKTSSIMCRPNMVSDWLTSGCGNTVACRHELIDRRGRIASEGAGSERMGGFEELPEHRPGQRRRKCVALGKENAPVAQIFHLFKILDPLGEDFHVHAA